MTKILPLYIKYTQYRKPEFQVKTEIIQENGTFFVLKSASNKESEIFIHNWNRSYKKLITANLPLAICPMTPINKKTLKFNFINGTLLIKELEDAAIKSSKGRCLDVFKKLEQIIEDFDSITSELDTNFSKIFGDYNLDTKYICINPGILDLNLDNIIVDDNARSVLIDYEWTFNFPIPKRYIQYRAIYYSFLHLKSILSNTISIESVEKEFNFSNSEIRIFLNWEVHFMKYVTGNKVDLDELIASRKNFGDLITKNDTMVTKQSEIDSLLIALKEELKASQEKLKASLEENRIKEEKLHNIYNSKSWKLTQPIREITRKIKDLNK